MPKVGEAMNLSEDPLIQYLRKEAAPEPKEVRVKSDEVAGAIPMKVSGGQLDDNEAKMETQAPAEELTTDPPDSSDKAKERTSDWRNYLKTQFKNSGAITSKHREKDAPSSAGVVNRVLNLK